MSKSLKILIFCLAVILGLSIYLEVNKPKVIDWNPGYKINDKIPFGLYVFDHEIDSIFNGNEIERIAITPYEYLHYEPEEDNYQHTDYEQADTFQNPMPQLDTLGSSATTDSLNEDEVHEDYGVDTFYRLVFININSDCIIDDESLKELIAWVREGHICFLSGQRLPEILNDSLGYATGYETINLLGNQDSLVELTLTASKYKEIKTKDTERIYSHNYFSKIDSATTAVLGKVQAANQSARPNFIMVNHGYGKFFIHLEPGVFSNYCFLKPESRKYATTILSYLPDGYISWFVKGQKENISNSPLRFIFSHPALKWAWILFIGGMALFMIFTAKRRQRIIPVIPPLGNTTLDFAKTIGNLYYLEGDMSDMINKKIIYFLERVRSDYYIDTTNLNDDFVSKLHLKTGKDKAVITSLIAFINRHRKSMNANTKEDLIYINNSIEQIFN